MDHNFINLTPESLYEEHLCCAIADKKHQKGVELKRKWLADRMQEGHVFRKLNAKGKVFIEYAPLETAWVPIEGKNYLYIYCLWVSGSFSGHGYGKELLEYCISDAKSQNKSGICVLSSKKKKPYLTDKKFMIQFGFETVDRIDEEYELLALSFDGEKPLFKDNAKSLKIDSKELTIYYGLQCPYIPNCLDQIKTYCNTHSIPITLIPVDTLEKAKVVPCIFNNWAIFLDGKFVSVHLLNETYLKKILNQ